MVTRLPFTQKLVADCLKCQLGFEPRVDSTGILEEQINKPGNNTHYVSKNTSYLPSDFIIWNLQNSISMEFHRCIKFCFRADWKSILSDLKSLIANNFYYFCE